MSKIVIALGGNALLEVNDKRNYASQVKRAKDAFFHLSEIIEKEDVIISHGNGPQVGDLILRNMENQNLPPALPMHTLVAMSQGLIGEILTEAYDQVRMESGISKESMVIMTRTLVDPEDPGFSNPSKPVGRAYTLEDVQQLKKIHDWEFVNTEKGYRRVVPSPKPLDIIEKGAIQSALINGYLPICTGGGGIPVIRNGNILEGVDAVVDKDSASYILAHMIESDELIILTDIEGAYVNFGKSNQEKIGRINSRDLQNYYNEGHFSKGSMGPKVKAAIDFVQHGGKIARIGKLQMVKDLISGVSGTTVVP